MSVLALKKKPVLRLEETEKEMRNLSAGHLPVQITGVTLQGPQLTQEAKHRSAV